ncbi:MAG: hypothetical protein SGI97_00740 [candidate division Zixibacteria bacterium]|nr:hypothetical protein [candidate division Zixibacteria bacterium]
MKQMLFAALVLAIACSSAEAGRKKEKAGDLEGRIYQDNSYDFSLTVNENWRSKIGAEKSNFRLILTQTNHNIPPDYLETPDYAQVPRLAIFADTTTLSASAFLDSLLSRSFASKQKSEILKEFDILSEPDVVPKGKKPMTLAGQTAMRWDGQAKYMKEVSLSASSVGGKRINSSYGGSIVAVKKDNTVILFHLICEWPSYEQVSGEAMSIINSLAWVQAPKE